MLRSIRRCTVGIVASLFCAVILSGCGFFAEEPDPTVGWSAQRLYDAGKASLDQGSYQDARFYQKLETRYPFGPYATQAQLDSAYAYYKQNEPASSVAAADRFIKLHPQHPNVDYAYYIKGLSRFEQGRGFIDQLTAPRPI